MAVVGVDVETEVVEVVDVQYWPKRHRVVVGFTVMLEVPCVDVPTVEVVETEVVWEVDPDGLEFADTVVCRLEDIDVEVVVEVVAVVAVGIMVGGSIGWIVMKPPSVGTGVMNSRVWELLLPAVWEEAMCSMLTESTENPEKSIASAIAIVRRLLFLTFTIFTN